LIKLFKDASTVREHGLEHPITVSKYQDGWMIQSGERRTLMHWALTYWLEDTKFSEISAIEVPQRSPWRQAAENNARSDLTAIERARQLALLLMDLYGPTRDFASYSELPGQAFYQQAAELSAPRSGGLEKILDAMGFASRAQLSQYRRLLTLPEEAWQLADEHRWSEKKIRTMFQVAQTPPEGWTEDQYLCYLARVEAGLEVLPDDRNDQLLTGVNNSRSKSSASQTPRATKTSHDDETDHPSFDENSGDHRVVIRGDDAPYADGNPPRDFNSLTARAQQIAIQQQRQRSPLFAAIADELQTARDLLTPDSLVDLSAHDRALLREQIASLITLLTPNAIDETKFIFSEAANLPLRPADWRGATGADFQEVQELKRRALARIGDLDEFLKTLR
jgi:ParB-like chromosome segregation protein Spo0J